MSFQNTRFVDKKMHAINNIPCRSFVRLKRYCHFLSLSLSFTKIFYCYGVKRLIGPPCELSKHSFCRQKMHAINNIPCRSFVRLKRYCHFLSLSLSFTKIFYCYGVKRLIGPPCELSKHSFCRQKNACNQ